jgi:peptidyl-prolyl cis-trans isomerase B (cyclophilin B)
MKILATFCALSLTLGLACAQSGEEKKAETKKDAAPAAAEKKDSAAAKEVAVIKTSLGEMVVEFWPDIAPKTVENFKTLAKKGFYDGTAFHRVIKGFMIQGGDPLTKDAAKVAMWGTGDPGYKIDAEFSTRPHVRGVISMARNGDPREQMGQPPRPQFANSAGSQFFICHATVPHLDGKYSAFGKLIKGEDVLDKIAETPVAPGANRPTTRVEVTKIEIVPADSIK